MQRHRAPVRGRALATVARCRCRECTPLRWRSRTAPPCSGLHSLPRLVDVHQDLEEEVEPEPDPEERARDEQPRTGAELLVQPPSRQGPSANGPGELPAGVDVGPRLPVRGSDPLAYLFSAYLVLDLPARWFAHRGAYGRLGALLFLASVVLAFVGITRAVHDAPPIAPVRPKFAKAMLGLSWLAALLCTIGDLASSDDRGG